jgi:hypothetical protein
MKKPLRRLIRTHLPLHPTSCSHSFTSPRAHHPFITPHPERLPPLPPYSSVLPPTSLPTALQQPDAPTLPSHPYINPPLQHYFPQHRPTFPPLVVMEGLTIMMVSSGLWITYFFWSKAVDRKRFLFLARRWTDTCRIPQVDTPNYVYIGPE